MKNNIKIQEFVLPKSIKEEIKNNITDLKELLKDDSEFTDKLVESIMCTGSFMLPSNIESLVYQHYDVIIKESQQQYKPWPKEIDKIKSIAYKLSSLASGCDEIILTILKDIKEEYDNNDCKILGDFVKVEINMQFDPTINYKYDVDLSGLISEDSDF